MQSYLVFSLHISHFWVRRGSALKALNVAFHHLADVGQEETELVPDLLLLLHHLLLCLAAVHPHWLASLCLYAAHPVQKGMVGPLLNTDN